MKGGAARPRRRPPQVCLYNSIKTELLFCTPLAIMFLAILCVTSHHLITDKGGAKLL